MAKSSSISVVKKAAIFICEKLVEESIDILSHDMRDLLLKLILQFARDKTPTTALEVPRFIETMIKCFPKDDLDRVATALEEICLSLLSSSEWRIRLNFVFWLKKIDYTRIRTSSLVSWFTTALEDEEEEIRIATAQNLPILFPSKTDIKSIIRKLLSDRSQKVVLSVVQVLSGYHDAEFVKESVSEVIVSKNPSIFVEGIVCLSALGFPESLLLSHITSFLDGATDWRFRQSVALGMKRLGFRSTKILGTLLKDDSIEVRSSVLDVMKDLELRNAIPMISELADSEDYQMRQTAVLAIDRLGLWNNAICKDIVDRLVMDPQSNVRLTVAKRIVGSDFVDTTGVIEILKGDSDEDVRDVFAEL
jgi:serine/threonine-protein phosphatase 2A regulatory subunit A